MSDGQTMWLRTCVCVCVSVSDSERRRPPTNEPSEVRHDGGHGHVDSPERSLGPLQPAEEIQHVDDLCQCLLSHTHSSVRERENSAQHLNGNYIKTCFIFLFVRPTPVCSVWPLTRTNGCQSTLQRWSQPIKGGVAQTRRHTSTPSLTTPTSTCCRVSHL